MCLILLRKQTTYRKIERVLQLFCSRLINGPFLKDESVGMRPLGFTYADILNCYVTTTHLKQESRLYLLFLILFTFLIALTGFLVTPSAQCPANEERFSSSGVILSPGFPSNYPNSQTCSWLLRMIPGTVCILSVCLSVCLWTHVCWNNLVTEDLPSAFRCNQRD